MTTYYKIEARWFHDKDHMFEIYFMAENDAQKQEVIDHFMPILHIQSIDEVSKEAYQLIEQLHPEQKKEK